MNYVRGKMENLIDRHIVKFRKFHPLGVFQRSVHIEKKEKMTFICSTIIRVLWMNE
jgi:hypothetical protein